MSAFGTQRTVQRSDEALQFTFDYDRSYSAKNCLLSPASVKISIFNEDGIKIHSCHEDFTISLFNSICGTKMIGKKSYLSI